MKKTRFSEEQIIAVLREQEGGMKTADVCRKHGISSASPASNGSSAALAATKFHASPRPARETAHAPPAPSGQP